MKWIKCSEKMPEDDNEVLVFSKDRYGDYYIEVAHLDRDYFMGEEFPVFGVTHWMPLPDAPDEE